MPLLRGCGTADWNFIRKRRRSSIARMSCGREDMTMRSSIFWGMNFAREDQRVALVRPFSTSVQRFPPRQQRRFGRGYEAGNYPKVVMRRSKNCLDSTIRSSGVVPILRAVLPHSALLDQTSTGPRAGLLGQKEIQKVTPTSPEGTTLDCSHLAQVSRVVCSLAGGT